MLKKQYPIIPQIRTIFYLLILFLATCLVLQVLTFFSAWFVRVPYGTTQIAYYLNVAKIRNSGHVYSSTDYSHCGKQSQDAYCNELDNTNATSLAIVIINITFLTITLFTIIYYLYKRYLHISVLCVLTLVLWVQFIISIYLFSNFMNKFPYSIYCDYDTGGCWYGQSIDLMIWISGIVLSSASLLSTVACGHKAYYNDSIYKPMNSYTNNDIMNANISKSCMKPTTCAIISIIMAVLTGILGLIIIFIIIAVEGLFSFDLTSDQTDYTNYFWYNATCINESGYYIEPMVSINELPCSFQPPSWVDQVMLAEYWTCCNSHTCNMAFDYSKLLTPYNNTFNNDDLCYIDMLALNKASCHPLDRWFVDTPFNISLSPQLSQHNIYLCSTFCYQIYQDCQSKYVIDSNFKTVKEFYNGSAFDFCQQGLGMNIRSEIFTDKCFNGCNQYSLRYVIMLVIFIVINIMM